MTTEQECIEALHEAAEQLGESPSRGQYDELGLTPAGATIMRTLGGWNAAKAAAGLETSPSTGSRMLPKPPDVDLPDHLDWAELTVDQRWHYRHRAENARRTRVRRRRIRRWVYEYKLESAGCIGCGESDPACLDFHHRDPDKKRMAVSKLVTFGHRIETIRTEIEKCELLCANCHAHEHASRIDWSNWVASTDDDAPTEVTTEDIVQMDGSSLGRNARLRAWAQAYQQSQGCRECGEDDPACLQFHHVRGEKTETVGSMLLRGASAQRVFAEIEKCDVLCANCHRQVHYQPPSVDVPSAGDSRG